jgi:hypothetical protein
MIGSEIAVRYRGVRMYGCTSDTSERHRHRYSRERSMHRIRYVEGQ